MGLSSKQVSSSRGLDWNQTLLQAQNLELPKASPMKKQQQQNQQSEQLKCPRCDSTNTKFCYYNNYNKSQPRHFCRACKRHWTKGGTLRNVPVGGGRKNKRAKKPATTSNGNSNNMEIQRQNLSLHLEVSDQKNITSSSSLYHQSMIPSLPTISLLPQQNNLISTTRDSEKGKDFDIGNGIFLSSTVPFSPNQNFLFPFSTSNSIDTNPCVVSSSSLRSSNVYNYGEEFKAMEEATINGNMPSSSTSNGTNTQPWEIPATSTTMEMSNYWSWEDLDSLVSTDLNGPWDDSEIKP